MNSVSPTISLRYEPIDADRETIRRLAESTSFFRPDEVDIAVELVDARLMNGLASGYSFIFAESDRQTLGYACYGPIGCTLGSFDLYWIIVDPAAQGQGLGRQLMQEAERLVRSAKGRRIYVETSSQPQYEPTRQFYLRCGYAIDAVLKDFYADGDDKVVLVKSLLDSSHV
ncbi:MAG: GNAT family N-acetyltransferase [Planctomycetaceae bacterium]